MADTIPTLLSKLTPVATGDNLLSTLTAERINALQELIAAALRGDCVLKGRNTSKTSGASWYQIHATRGGNGIDNGNSTGGPWEVIAGTDPDTVRVATNSSLLESLNLNSEITIAGIDDDFTLTKDQVLYLQLDYTSGSVSAVSLVADDQWDEYPVPFHQTGAGTLGDPYVISQAYFPIGYAYDTKDADDLEGVEIQEIKSGKPTGVTLKVVRMCFVPLVLKYENTGTGFIVQYPNCGTRFGGAVI